MNEGTRAGAGGVCLEKAEEVVIKEASGPEAHRGCGEADLRPRVWAGQQHSSGWVVGSTCQEWKASGNLFSHGADAEPPARAWPHKNHEAASL